MDATLALAGEVPQPSHWAPVSGMWLFMPLSQWKGSEVSAGLAYAEKAHPLSPAPLPPLSAACGPCSCPKAGHQW